MLWWMGRVVIVTLQYKQYTGGVGCTDWWSYSKIKNYVTKCVRFESHLVQVWEGAVESW